MICFCSISIECSLFDCAHSGYISRPLKFTLHSSLDTRCFICTYTAYHYTCWATFYTSNFILGWGLVVCYGVFQWGPILRPCGAPFKGLELGWWTFLGFLNQSVWSRKQTVARIRCAALSLLGLGHTHYQGFYLLLLCESSSIKVATIDIPCILSRVSSSNFAASSCTLVILTAWSAKRNSSESLLALWCLDLVHCSIVWTLALLTCCWRNTHGWGRNLWRSGGSIGVYCQLFPFQTTFFSTLWVTFFIFTFFMSFF